MPGARSAIEWEQELDLAGALGRMRPPSVLTGVRRIAVEDEAELYLPERAHIATARPARRREFATGRALLREVIDVNVAIPVGDDRRPVLPAGVCASLAHDDTWAVAAATRDREYTAVGIDIEPEQPLEPDVAELILHPDDVDLDGAPLNPRLAFTLKEAAYKAWSAAGGGMLDHQDLRLVASESTFSAYDAEWDVVARGTHATTACRILALALIRRD